MTAGTPLFSEETVAESGRAIQRVRHGGPGLLACPECAQSAAVVLGSPGVRREVEARCSMGEHEDHDPDVCDIKAYERGVLALARDGTAERDRLAAALADARDVLAAIVEMDSTASRAFGNLRIFRRDVVALARAALAGGAGEVVDDPLSRARLRFWVCPRGHSMTPPLRVTVEWDDAGIAHCTTPGCPETSAGEVVEPGGNETNRTTTEETR